MSDDAATEWLTVCATDVRQLPLIVLQRAATEAARVCTRHGEIIPAILASEAVKSHEAHQQLVRAHQPEPTLRLEPPRWKPEPGETATIIAEAAKLLGGRQ